MAVPPVFLLQRSASALPQPPYTNQNTASLVRKRQRLERRRPRCQRRSRRPFSSLWEHAGRASACISAPREAPQLHHNRLTQTRIQHISYGSARLGAQASPFARRRSRPFSSLMGDATRHDWLCPPRPGVTVSSILRPLSAGIPPRADRRPCRHGRLRRPGQPIRLCYFLSGACLWSRKPSRAHSARMSPPDPT